MLRASYSKSAASLRGGSQTPDPQSRAPSCLFLEKQKWTWECWVTGFLSLTQLDRNLLLLIYFHVPWSCVQESCESTTFICKIEVISAVMWHRTLPVLQKKSEVTVFLVLLLFSPKSCLTFATVACQAPLCMGFPRQDYWSGLSFPSPGDLPD